MLVGVFLEDFFKLEGEGTPIKKHMVLEWTQDEGIICVENKVLAG
jgi:hypothetical protein